jgi:hypothetical protein
MHGVIALRLASTEAVMQASLTGLVAAILILVQMTLPAAEGNWNQNVEHIKGIEEAYLRINLLNSRTNTIKFYISY